ncbi:MAG: amidohydrolase [Thermoplasmata archaeon]
MGEAAVWLSGRIFTGRRYVEALVVEEGRVLAAGSRRSVRRERPTGSNRLESGSGLVIPGLIDPHVHLLSTTLAREGVNLEDVRSIEELLSRVQRWMDLHRDGPVLGRGWDQERLEDQRYPTRADLDRLTTRRPVVLYRVCAHAAVVNSPVMDTLGLTARSADPKGGRFGRGSDGEPNGLLYDNALYEVYPILSRSILGEPSGLRRTLDLALRVGLTSLASLGVSPEEVHWGKQQGSESPSRIRLRFYLDLRHVETVREGSPPDLDPVIRLVGVKAVLDGSLGARTAWLREPYADARQERGLSLWSTGELTRKLERAVGANLRIALHAIGDAALASAIDLLTANPTFRPVRIEHASLVPPDLLERLAVLAPDIVVQPLFVASDTWIEDRLGPERARWTYPFRALKARKLRLAASSDAPVERLDPWPGLRSLTHPPAFRSAFEDKSRRISFSAREAFEMYTTAAGECLGEPDLGHLEPGGRGDFLLLSAPTLDSAIAAGSSTVRSTWVGGRRVHSNGSDTNGHGLLAA